MHPVIIAMPFAVCCFYFGIAVFALALPFENIMPARLLV
jgi:hypothetical protein